MGALRHLLIVVVIGVVFRWLWKSSLNEHASVEAVRTVFPPTRAVRILAVLFGVAFTRPFYASRWMALDRVLGWDAKRRSAERMSLACATTPATSNSPCVLTMVARSLTPASTPNLACFRTRFRSAPVCP